MVAPSPTSVTGLAPPCRIEPSCTLAPRRTMIGPKSARSTAPYQTDAPASTRTSPTGVGVGAIQASGLMSGSRPSKANSGISASYKPAQAAPGQASVMNTGGGPQHRAIVGTGRDWRLGGAPPG